MKNIRKDNFLNQKLSISNHSSLPLLCKALHNKGINIYNETTGHKLMMFHLEDATAVINPMMGEAEKIDC